MTKHTFQFPDKFNASDKQGAGLICEAVVAYWAARGFVVRVSRAVAADGVTWCVRSNLVNGLPRRR